MKLKKNNLSKFLLALPVVAISFVGFAQDGENLIDNPGFENADSRKLRRIGDIDRAHGWTSATGMRADLFSADAREESLQTPENIYGTESPKEGVNYAGIIAYSYREKENRSYLQTQLSTPMKKGMRYKVQFYASLSELSKYSSNRLGAYFSRRPIGSDARVPAIIMDETHVEHPNQAVFNGMYGWDLVCGEYVAQGNERYITIGNFSNDNDIKTERMRKPREAKGQQIIAAYYYIDDVSVELLGPDEECNCEYGDEAVFESFTVFQRSPEITPEMSDKERIAQYNIYYAVGRYDVRADGERALDEIAKLMKENSNIKIEVVGHTDSQEASDPQERVVSMRRAEYVKTLLEDRGIDGKRILVHDLKDARESQYIDNYDDEDVKYAKNRRVSFKAL